MSMRAWTRAGRSGMTVAAVGILLLAAGCGEDERQARERRAEQLGGADRDTVMTTDRRGSDGAARSWQGSDPSDTSRSFARERQQGQGGRYSLAIPTGDRQSSVLLVEKTMPQRVVVSEVADYTIQVTNLTDQPLANVWVMETAGQGLAFMAPEQAPAAQQPAQFQSRMESPYQQRWEISQLEPRQTATIHVHAVPRQLGETSTTLTAGYEPTIVAKLEVLAPGQEYIQGPDSLQRQPPVVRRNR